MRAFNISQGGGSPEGEPLVWMEQGPSVCSSCGDVVTGITILCASDGTRPQLCISCAEVAAKKLMDCVNHLKPQPTQVLGNYFHERAASNLSPAQRKALQILKKAGGKLPLGDINARTRKSLESRKYILIEDSEISLTKRGQGVAGAIQ